MHRCTCRQYVTQLLTNTCDDAEFGQICLFRVGNESLQRGAVKFNDLQASYVFVCYFSLSEEIVTVFHP